MTIGPVEESAVIEKHLKLLGLRMRDRVTGFEGVVTSISFDLFGCIQGCLKPKVKDGKIPDAFFFDVNRLETVLGADRVMPVPDFFSQLVADGGHGPAEKPMPDHSP